MNKNNILTRVDSFKIKFSFSKISLFSTALILSLAFPSMVSAAAVVTPLTGGDSISADTAGGSYTTVAGPILSEGSPGDIGVGTIILNAPTGFIFDTGGLAPSVLVLRIAGTGTTTNKDINHLASGATSSVAVSSTTLTFTVTSSSNGNVRNSLTWQNIRVRPTANFPLAGGNVTSSGTSVIAGVTSGSTSFGTLTEIGGTVNKLVFTTQPGSAVYGSDLSTQPVIETQDQFGNFTTIGLLPVEMVSLSLTSGTGTLIGTTTLDIGTGAGNGTVTFNNLRVDMAGTGKKITATSTTLAGVESSSFDISQAVPVLFLINSSIVWDGSPHAAEATSSVPGVISNILLDGTSTQTATGTYAVTADFVPTDTVNYSSLATSSIGNFTISDKLSQFITFNPLANKTYGDADFTVSATTSATSSPLVVTFGVTGNCTLVSTSTIHITGAGSCTVTASQAGDGTYYAAVDVLQTFLIAKALPIINWANPADITYGTPLSATQLNATSSVAGAFVYSPVSGMVLSAGADQTLQVNFTPTDTANYDIANGAVLINVLKATPTLFVTNSPTVWDGLPHSATVSGSVPGVISNILLNGTSTQTATGTYAVTADLAPTDADNYNSLTNEPAGDFVISGNATQTISFAPLADKNLGDADFTVSATSSSGLPVTFGVTGNCNMIASTTVHITGAGSCTVTASQAGDVTYGQALDVLRTFNVISPTPPPTPPSFGGGGGFMVGGSFQTFFNPNAATPATPATPAVPGESPAIPATPAIPGTGRVLGASTFNFLKNLRMVTRGNDVIELQKFLIAEGYLNIPLPTGYFGPLTKRAVMKWQKANGLPSTGYFGPMSRGLINRINNQ